MATGDLLFYHATPWDMADMAIVANNYLRGKHSDIVHVAIDLGNSTLIEALGSGVRIRPYKETENFIRWDYPDEYRQEPYDGRFTEAVQKLEALNGLPYGWGDIVQAAFIFGWPFIDVDPQHYDCASLALWFLMNTELDTGIALYFVHDPHNETPVMLAYDLGAVK